MGRIDATEVEEVVSDFRTLAEENRKRYQKERGENNLTAASIYEDAANHLEQELLDDHTDRD